MAEKWTNVAEHAVQNFVSYVLISIAGGFVWVIRRLLTDKTAIELLKADNAARNEMRERDREDLREVKEGIKALNENVLKIFQNHGG